MPEESRVVEVDVVAIYRTIASLSKEDERALMRHLSAEMRAALWRHHLKTFIEAHHDLTEDQRSIIEEGRNLLSQPAFFTGDGSGFEDHKARVFAAFPPQLAHRLFFRLGRVDF